MGYYGRKLLIGAVGILASTMSISYLVEKLFSQKYPSIATAKNQPNGHYFLYPTLVTWLGCLFCTIYGMIYAHFVDKNPNNIPVSERFRLGLFFTLNYLPTNYALLFISYPLQVVGKNTRYLLVVIVGVFFSRVKQSRQLKLPRSKVLIAILITLGAALFMFFDSNIASNQNHFNPDKKWIGLLLLLLAIICDALFSDNQAYCKAYFQPTSNQLFLAANLYAFALIFIFAMLKGQLKESIVFCIKHPRVIIDLFMMGILQVISQISVYYVISNFKQHIYPLISTVRKLFTILLSILLFKHKINLYQWMSIIIVFLAMGYELYDEIESQEQHRRIRKDRMEQQYMKIVESKQQSQSSQIPKRIQQKPKNQKAVISGRRNYHMGEISEKREPAEKQEQSLSKYGYRWRKDEVYEHRQTSLTPLIDKIK